MDAKVSQVEALHVLYATPRMNDTWYIRSPHDPGHPEKLQDVAIETHISLPLTCPFVAALFLRLRCVAKSALSRIEATVSTPPTMAHVEVKKVRKRLARFAVGNEDR